MPPVAAPAGSRPESPSPTGPLASAPAALFTSGGHPGALPPGADAAGHSPLTRPPGPGRGSPIEGVRDDCFPVLPRHRQRLRRVGHRHRRPPDHAGATADDGPPGLRITGLPDAAVRETRDRVYAAVRNSGQPWPARAITVTLQPASLPRHGTGFDLAIAIAVLTAAGAVPAAALDGCVFTAELGLDGSLRPVRGVLPALLAARRAGYTRAVVATGNAAEAVMVAGLAVVPCPDLRTVLAWLRGESFPHQPDISAAGTPAAPGVPPGASLASLAIPPYVRQAIEATAAGGHHLCLTGPHGARIPALAAGAAALMPPLEPEQMMEVTAIHSAAGLLGPGHALITRPPFRAPHHTATRAAILGGGTGTIRPGEAALAHRGVLFLHDAPEFPRDILTSLRQPCSTARSRSPGPA